MTSISLIQTISLPSESPKKQASPIALSHLPAGFPSPAADYAEARLDLNEYLITNQIATYFFTVKGDSMSGASIVENDKVVVNRALSPRHGDIVVAEVNGEFTLKRLYKQQNRVELHPENPKHNPIVFKHGDELQIWGVVVGVVRKYL